MEKQIKRKIREFTNDIVKSDQGIFVLFENGDEDLLSISKNITKTAIISFILDAIIEDSDVKNAVSEIIYKLNILDNLIKIETMATENENRD